MSSLIPSSLTSGSSTSSGSSGSTALSNSGSSGTVTSTGLGSGLDINSIVTSLVAAEGQGQTALYTAQTNQIQAQISAYGQLQSAVTALQASLVTLSTQAQFSANAASVADKTVASASANSSAIAGSYTLEVDALATGAQLISNPVANANTAVGTGTLTINVGTTAIPVTITSTNNTLSGIAAAINAAGSAHGVGASLLTTSAGVRLVLTSATTGAANAVTVSQTGGDGGLSVLAYDPASTNPTGQLSQITGAQDAQLKIDGYATTSASNVVTTALSGVTINLTGQTASGATTTLTVAPDQSGSQTAVQTFVQSYNTLATAVSQLSSYDASTSTAGPLLGDPLLNNLVTQLHNAINGSVGSLKNGPFSTLAEIGITANADGTLSINQTKLQNAFTNNYGSITTLFSASDGVATQISNVLNSFTQPQTGVFAEENSSLQQSLTNIANQQTALNQRLANLQTTLLAQYNAMDNLVAQLKNTGTTVMAELNSVYYPGKASTAVP